eukprot:TRINITY_DN29163_c0_g1_i1.p1 TRINITY_DN29163_c0_g1~~TRINITY_DN29163_c0_g1_i1.p1  ORF type:complete len:167 (+),score=46.41 TRINITY_DN29163_c0_g1_i1:210-710(+)
MGFAGHSAQNEAAKMIEHADKNKDGVVDFEEFKQVWYRKVLSTNDQYIHRVFDVFDDNGDGHIDPKELGQILFPEQYDAGSDANEDGAEEQKLNDEEEQEYQDDEDGFLQTVQKMIGEVDEDGDGKISFDEFKKAMKEDVESGTLGFAKSAENDDYGGLIGPKIVE